MKLITVIQKCPILKSEATSDGVEIVKFRADMDIDCDGSGGNPHHDPCFQSDTTLHAPDGKALNAERVPFIVVPPVICRATKLPTLGSMAFVTNILNGMTVQAVVGDIGPQSKVGEGSPRLAELLGLNPNPNNGGVDFFCIDYEIQNGVAALIDGVQYRLKSYHG